MLKSIEPDLCVVNVDARPDMDMRAQAKCFFATFGAYETTKKFYLVTTGLFHQFAGDAYDVEAEWIGVPKLNIILYFGVDNGRRASTGNHANLVIFNKVCEKQV